MEPPPNAPTGMTIRSLVPFLAFTFGLTWGIAAILILFTDEVVAIFGEITWSNPLFILAVHAPGFVAVAMVWRAYGLAGLGSFFRRLTLWRAPMAWWAFLVLGIPAVYYLSAAVKGTIDDPFPYSPWTTVLPALALAFFLGTIEEFGWRGIALPLLQRRFAPAWAGLVLGVIHAVWHTPAFLLSGTPQSAWSFAPFFAGTVAISVILTSLFNEARGSLLIPYLYHFQLINPLWPDGQPWDNLVFSLVTVLVVVLNRRAMFRRGAGVTEVLMEGEEDPEGTGA